MIRWLRSLARMGLAVLPMLPPSIPSAALGSHPTTPPSRSAEGTVIVTPVGHIGGRIEAVALQHPYAYIGTGKSLLVLNITDPNRPAVVGSVRLASAVRDVTVAGSYAYVATWDAVWIVDVSHPDHPWVAGSAPGGASRITIAGRYLYAAYVADDWSGGLRILDVSRPDAPHEVSRYQESFFFASSVALGGNYAYVQSLGQIVIIDVSDPTHPRKVKTIDPSPGRLNDRIEAVVGNYAYGVASDDVQKELPTRVLVMDVRNPSDPQIIGSLEIPELTGESHLAVSGHYAYVIGVTGDPFNRRGSLQIVDISDPRNPRRVGSASFLTEPTDVAASGRYVYVTDRWAGVVMFDVSDPRNPRQIASLELPGSIEQVATDGSFIYVVSNRRLGIMPAPNPTPPWLVGGLDLGQDLMDGIRDIAAAMNRVYIVYYIGGRVEIVDTRNPAAPQVFRPSFRAMGVDARGNLLYVAGSGLEIYDVTDPSSPRRIGAISIGGTYDSLYGVSVAGDYAYARSSSQVHIVDIRNPASPRLVGSYEAPVWRGDGEIIIANSQIRDVAGGSYYAALAYPKDETSDRLEILDVSRPDSPRVASRYELPPGWEAVGVEAEGPYVYLLSAKCPIATLEPIRSTLQVFDVRDPFVPRLIGTYNIPGCASDLRKEADYLYIAMGQDGMAVMRIQELNRSVYLPLVLRGR